MRHITNCYGHDCFGQFRVALLGLLGAHAYEQSMMGAANRLITRDVFGALRRYYLLSSCVHTPGHVLVLHAHPPAGEEGGGGRPGPGGGGAQEGVGTAPTSSGSTGSGGGALRLAGWGSHGV